MEAIGIADAGTWVVAHSLGGITVLRALATLTEPWKLGGFVLVSGFTGPLETLPALNEYLNTDVDAERIARNIGVRAMVRADADAFVPPAASDELARRLHAELLSRRDIWIRSDPAVVSALKFENDSARG